MKLLFIFPGQGAQYIGMGQDFIRDYSRARLILEEAEDLLRRKIASLIFSGSEEELKRTENSQLAIFVISYAMYKVIEELFPEMVPVTAAGLSLGEYTALAASGAISFAQCLELVKYRSAYMNECCEKRDGRMAAVLGLDPRDIDSLVRQADIPNDLWVANYNCPGQAVLSGTIKGVEMGARLALERGARRVIPLNVHGAFHSGLMLEARERLAPRILALELTKGCCPVIMNFSATATSDVAEIKNNLIEQVTGSVRWQQSIEFSERNIFPDLYVEVGPGKTLTGFNKRIGVRAKTVNVEKIEDLKHLEKEVKR